MNTLNLVILCTAVVLALSGYSAAATSCYVCTSAQNNDCGEDDFSSITNIANSQTGCNYCTKTVLGIAGSNALVTRGCQEDCLALNTGIGTRTLCCDSLLCNSATYIRPAAVLMVIAASLVLAMF